MNQSATTNHPAYSHLLGYRPCNEGKGGSVADTSTSSNMGQLVNGTAWTGGRVSNTGSTRRRLLL